MKIAASILLLLITGSSLLYYGYFDIMLLRSKEKARHSLAAARHDHSLRVFKVSANQQDRYSDDEVRINGNLYDIGDREIINDTLYLSLYHDTDEQNILSDISDFFKADDATAISGFPDKPSFKSVRIIFNLQYYFEALNYSLRIDTNAVPGSLNNTVLTSLPFYDIIIPPPRLS